MARFGIAGTVTHDVITASGKIVHEGLGGILYQAAILCGRGYPVYLYTNLGVALEKEVEDLTKEWRTLHTQGVLVVPGPGNRVFLNYPPQGERTEVLESVVPPIDPHRILEDLPQLDFFIMVLNSGLDMEWEDWEKVKKKAACPVWLDIHSLLLQRAIGRPREYVPLQGWKEWVEGVDYLQANKAEWAAMMGRPAEALDLDELESFGAEVFELDVKAVFLTLGEEGVLLMEKGGSKRIKPTGSQKVMDSTGCGDVFCAAAAAFLSEGRDPVESAAYGMRTASAAVSSCGVASLFHLKNILFSFD